MVGGLRDVTTRVCCREVAQGRTLAQLSEQEQQALLRAALEDAIRGRPPA